MSALAGGRAKDIEGGHRCLRPGYIFEGGVACCLRRDTINIISARTCTVPFLTFGYVGYVGYVGYMSVTCQLHVCLSVTCTIDRNGDTR